MRFGTYYRYALIKQLKLDNIIKTADIWLDIGCYDGTILECIDVQRKVGVDLEVKRKPNINLVKALIEYLPFRDELFGVITAFDVLEHIKEDTIIINQVESKLKKGGKFLLSVPHEKEKIFPKFLKKWLVFHKWKHVRLGYDQRMMNNLFQKGWILNFIYWNNDVSNFLYFPLQFIWKITPEFAKIVIKKIINKLIEIEFIRTKRNSLNQGHIITIAQKE